jgi:DUF971 family protein
MLRCLDLLESQNPHPLAKNARRVGNRARARDLKLNALEVSGAWARLSFSDHHNSGCSTPAFFARVGSADL